MSTDSLFISEADDSTFQSLVLDRSINVPVLVDFWAEWCAPCKMLMPILAQLANEYQGKFQLVKVNTDEQQPLAMQYGVRSLPTLKLFRNGEIVDEIIGVQPESAIRAIIDRYIVRESDFASHDASELVAQGNLDEALELLRKTIDEDPGNPRPQVEMTRLLIKMDKLEDAAAALDQLPSDDSTEESARELTGRLEFARTAKAAPPPGQLELKLITTPDDHLARCQLAAHMVVNGEYEAALELLLELLKRDRNYNKGIAQRLMLAVFDILDDDDELISTYRRRMFALLH